MQPSWRRSAWTGCSHGSSGARRAARIVPETRLRIRAWILPTIVDVLDRERPAGTDPVEPGDGRRSLVGRVDDAVGHRDDGIVVGPDRADDRMIDLERRHRGVDHDARHTRLRRRSVAGQRDAGHERAVDEAEPPAADRRADAKPGTDEDEPVQGEDRLLREVDEELGRQLDDRTEAIGCADLDPGALVDGDRDRLLAAVVARHLDDAGTVERGDGGADARFGADRGLRADERGKPGVGATPELADGAVVEGHPRVLRGNAGTVDGQCRWQDQPAELRVDEHRVDGRAGPAAGDIREVRGPDRGDRHVDPAERDGHARGIERRRVVPQLAPGDALRDVGALGQVRDRVLGLGVAEERRVRTERAEQVATVRGRGRNLHRGRVAPGRCHGPARGGSRRSGCCTGRGEGRSAGRRRCGRCRSKALPIAAAGLPAVGSRSRRAFDGRRWFMYCVVASRWKNSTTLRVPARHVAGELLEHGRGALAAAEGDRVGDLGARGCRDRPSRSYSVRYPIRSPMYGTTHAAHVSMNWSS